MANSIRTTSNTQATTNSPPATFKAGDAVLCPSIDNDSPKTFLDAQVAFAQSKHGKKQKRKETQGSRYQQIKQAATQARSDAKECKDES